MIDFLLMKQLFMKRWVHTTLFKNFYYNLVCDNFGLIHNQKPVSSTYLWVKLVMIIVWLKRSKILRPGCKLTVRVKLCLGKELLKGFLYREIGTIKIHKLNLLVFRNIKRENEVFGRKLTMIYVLISFEKVF